MLYFIWLFKCATKTHSFLMHFRWFHTLFGVHVRAHLNYGDVSAAWRLICQSQRLARMDEARVIRVRERGARADYCLLLTAWDEADSCVNSPLFFSRARALLFWNEKTVKASRLNMMERKMVRNASQQGKANLTLFRQLSHEDECEGMQL